MPGTPAGSKAEPVFRSGFVTFVGRPNVGKSTLTNALVGEKVAITSDKPQTTRRAIRGILNRTDGQLVIVDTPGIHRPRTLLGERLNHLVEQVLGDVDVIGFCVPATEKVGPGDRRIAESLDGYRRAKKVAIVTKTDAASREQVTERLLEVDALRDDWAAVIPLSALTNEQLDVLTGEVLALMPEGPALYPEGVVTDESVDDRIAEIIREAALEGVRDELPHSIAVVVQDIAKREDSDLTDIFADVVVERDSQKSIIIGHKGSRLADVGTTCPRADRAPHRLTRVSVAARAGREGMAARPQAARQAGVLIDRYARGVSLLVSSIPCASADSFLVAATSPRSRALLVAELAVGPPHLTREQATTMDNSQKPSGMPIHKYRPYHEQIAVQLPDRTWPDARITTGTALVRRRSA